METQEAIKKRRSVRTFISKPIPPNLIEQLIDSARLASTARNLQPWEFIIITQKETLQNLSSLVSPNGTFIKDSSSCIAVFCKDTKYYLEDGCAATENILIQATDLGLSSCWVAGDKKPYCDKVKKLLNVPEDFKLVSLIPLGYPNSNPQMPTKRSLREVLHWERF